MYVMNITDEHDFFTNYTNSENADTDISIQYLLLENRI